MPQSRCKTTQKTAEKVRFCFFLPGAFQGLRLLQLQLGLEFLPCVPGADSLGGALFDLFFRPYVEIFRHIDLGQAEAAVFARCVTADRLGLRISEEDSSASHRCGGVIDHAANDNALAKILRLCRRQHAAEGRWNHSGRQGGKQHPGDQACTVKLHSSSSSSSNSSSSSSSSSPTLVNSRGSTPTTSYSVPHSSQATTSPSSTSSISMSRLFSHSGQLGMAASSLFHRRFML